MLYVDQVAPVDAEAGVKQTFNLAPLVNSVGNQYDTTPGIISTVQAYSWTTWLVVAGLGIIAWKILKG